MAFWIVGAGAVAATATNNAAMSPGLPAGWAADDIHILVIHTSSNTDIAGPASGWTSITPSGVSPNNTSAQRVEIFWRRAVGGDAAPTVPGIAATAVRICWIVGVRGCVTSGDPFSDSSRLNNAASATVSTTNISPSDISTLGLFLYAYEDDPTGNGGASGWNAITPVTSSLGNDAALGGFWRYFGAAGSYGTPTTVVSGGSFSNSPNVGILLALKPAVASEGYATFKDDFSDGSMASEWTLRSGGTGGSTAETGGQLVITPPSSGGGVFNGYSSDLGYNLTGAAATVRMVNAGPQLSGNATHAQLLLTTTDLAYSHYLRWTVYEGAIYAQRTVNGVTTDLYTTTYSGTTHAWFRIREESGTIYWDTSDGTTWTNRATSTLANAFDVQNLMVFLISQSIGGGPTGTTPNVVFDNFGGPAITASRSVPATAVLAGVYSRSVPATAVILADTSFTNFVPATAVLTGTYSRSVPATAVLLDSNLTRSVPVTAVISSIYPNPPSGLMVTERSCSQADLSWTDNSSAETGFVVERSTDGSTWAAIQYQTQSVLATTFETLKLTPNTVLYTDGRISADTLYYWRVRAINAAGQSAPSNVVSLTMSEMLPQTTKITVFMYNNGSNWSDYQTRMVAAADSVRYCVVDLGYSQGEHSYYSSFDSFITALQAAGIKVMGYVATQRGTEIADGSYSRTLASTMGYIDEWYSLYNPDGIFLDEGGRFHPNLTANTGDNSSNSATTTYYEQIYRYIKTKTGGNDTIVYGNPAQYLPDDWAAGCFDVFLVREDNGTYWNANGARPWYANYPAERLGGVVYGGHTSADPSTGTDGDAGTSASDTARALAILDTARARNLGNVFITYRADNAAIRPYEKLPDDPYWQALVDDVALGSPSATFADFSDSFTDGTTDPRWTVLTAGTGGAVNETGGQLVITPNSNGGGVFNGYGTVDGYSLIGQDAAVQLVNAGPQGGSDNNTTFVLLRASLANFDNMLEWVVSQGTIYAQYVAGGSTVPLYSTAYNGTTHAWLRIREDAGSIYWEVSSDGASWALINGAATVTTATLGFAINALYAQLVAQTSGVSSTTTPNVVFDNWGGPPPLPFSRLAPATAVLLAIESRSVPATAVLSTATGTREVPSTAVLLGTYSRSAPATAVLSGTAFVTTRDNFDDGTTHARWTVVTGGAGGAATEASGQLVVTPNSDGGGVFNGYQTTAGHNLTGDSATVELVNAGPHGPSDANSAFLLLMPDPDYYGNALQWQVNDNTIYASHYVGGVLTNVYNATYSATTHRWLRITESGGFISWWTSDGTTWTQRGASVAVSALFPVASLHALLVGHTYGGASTTTPNLIFDNWGGLARAVPVTAVLARTHTRSVPATAVLTGTYSRSATATAVLTGTYSRSAPATAVLSTSQSRSVPATAALVATESRSVPATVVLVRERTVPATVVLTGAYTRSVPATAVLSEAGTFTAQVPASAVLTGTYSRLAPATAVLLASETRTVPTTAVLGAIAQRTVPATAVLVATEQRLVPVTAALVTIGQRTVPVSAALVLTPTRTVPATVVLTGRYSRTVPATAVLVRERAVPVSVVINRQRSITVTAVLAGGAVVAPVLPFSSTTTDEGRPSSTVTGTAPPSSTTTTP